MGLVCCNLLASGKERGECIAGLILTFSKVGMGWFSKAFCSLLLSQEFRNKTCVNRTCDEPLAPPFPARNPVLAQKQIFEPDSTHQYWAFHCQK